MKEEMIVMVRIGPEAWIPVHVLAYDRNDAAARALEGLSLAGVDFTNSPSVVVTFDQGGSHVNYRSLKLVE